MKIRLEPFEQPHHLFVLVEVELLIARLGLVRVLDNRFALQHPIQIILHAINLIRQLQVVV